VAVGLSAQRIYQDLVCEHGFTGGYQAVKRFARHLRETQPVPFVRMEAEPGAEARVDFGPSDSCAILTGNSLSYSAFSVHVYSDE
jgi:hypothetical protein